MDAALSPSYVDVVNLTVCYQTQDGTFRTVPRVITSTSTSTAKDKKEEKEEVVQIDRNFKITTPQPTSWSSIPAEVEVGVPFTLTFTRSTSNIDFLSVNDTAFLIFTDSTIKNDKTKDSNANANANANNLMTGNDICDISKAVLVSSSLTLDVYHNLVWSIPGHALTKVG